MRHLESSQIARLGRLLDERARALRDEIRQELLRSDEQHHRDLAGMVEDEGDAAVANMLADLEAAMLDRHVRELREIDAARGRLAAGTFGLCADCGDSIAVERLEAYPTATRCARCAGQHEKTHAHEGTPTL